MTQNPQKYLDLYQPKLLSSLLGCYINLLSSINCTIFDNHNNNMRVVKAHM